MEVRHLRAFVAVAEELHFGRAATRLQLSASPVSRTVLELERELGVQLFARGHHRVQLTEAGASLLPDARRLLAAWTELVARGRAMGRAAIAPRVRIGSPSLASSEVVDKVVAVLADIDPDLPTHVEFAATVELLEALRRRELDLTVAHLPLHEPDLRVLSLARYRVCVVVPSDDQFAHRGELLPEDLAGRHVLQLSSVVQPATMERMIRWLSGLGAVVEQLEDPDLIRLAQLVRHGRGITLSSATGVSAQIFSQPGLTMIPLRDAGSGIELGLVWRADSETSALVQELVPRLAALTRDGPLPA